MLVGFLLRFFYEPQAVSSSTRDWLLLLLSGWMQHIFMDQLQLQFKGMPEAVAGGFPRGGGCDFLEPCLSAWAAMLIAKAFVMSSHTNSHPTMVLCYI